MVWLPLVLALALPFGWENSLAGFQSQFYFLLVFSLLTLWLLGLHPPESARWWCGAAAAVMALFTLASGFLAAAAVFALVLVSRLAKRPARLETAAVTLTLAFCAVVRWRAAVESGRQASPCPAGPLGRRIPGRPRNNLAWPWIVVPPLALLNLLPLRLSPGNISKRKKRTARPRR